MTRMPTAWKKSPLEQVNVSELNYIFEEYLDYQRASCTDVTLRNTREKLLKFSWWWGRYHAAKGMHPTHVTVREAREFVIYLKSPITGYYSRCQTPL
jgi:hypothetical protein